MHIPLNASTLTDEEREAVLRVFDSGFVTMGKECLAFEIAFGQAVDTPHAIMVNSGSSANLLAFAAIASPLITNLADKPQLLPGDEVIVPALTWSTTIWPVIQHGAIPVLVDCQLDTLQIDVDQIEAAITDKTKAICVAHLLGNATPMLQLKEIAKQHNLWLIEDTCEALGTRHAGKTVGTIGDIGTYSFYFSHHITTIEGGMIVTPHAPLADLFRSLRAHGWTRQMENRLDIETAHSDIDPNYLFISTGYNVRPTDINAAIGQVQLKKLGRFNAKRVETATTWCDAFADIMTKGHLQVMQTTKNTDPTWFGFPVLCKDNDTKRAFQSHLNSHGIETRPILCGNMQRQPGLAHHTHRVHGGNCPHADEVMARGIYWGIHPVMTDADIHTVIDTVKGFFV